MSEQELRPAVLAFARAMEERLQANDHKGGWADCSTESLLDRLREETRELDDAVRAVERWEVGRGTGSPPRAPIVREAADVACFALFIADVFGRVTETTS